MTPIFTIFWSSTASSSWKKLLTTSVSSSLWICPLSATILFACSRERSVIAKKADKSSSEYSGWPCRVNIQSSYSKISFSHDFDFPTSCAAWGFTKTCSLWNSIILIRSQLLPKRLRTYNFFWKARSSSISSPPSSSCLDGFLPITPPCNRAISWCPKQMPMILIFLARFSFNLLIIRIKWDKFWIHSSLSFADAPDPVMTNPE